MIKLIMDNQLPSQLYVTTNNSLQAYLGWLKGGLNDKCTDSIQLSALPVL